jgi:6-phosphogluconolactonase
MNTTTELIVKSPAELAAVFVDRLLGLSLRARAEDRPLSVALPGGSVAEMFLPAVAQAPLDWEAIEWFWGDERAVPPDHPDSNFRVAHDLLFSRVPIDVARIHRIRGEARELETAASDYEFELLRMLGVPPRFDLVLAGVGPDGHVCSLFPEHPALAEGSRFVMPVVDAPKPPPQRITVTLPALADTVLAIAAFGPSKAFAIVEALENRTSNLPVALAVRAARHAVVLVDQSAAGRLTS